MSARAHYFQYKYFQKVEDLPYSKKTKEKIYNIFPKALIGAITAVIGLNLMTFIPTYVQINGNTSQWGIIIAMITMLATALISHYAKGIIRILPFLLGTLVGYIAAAAITLLGWCQIVDFNIFNNIKNQTILSIAAT